MSDGKQLLVLKGHSFHVWGVAFSPDGKRLASAGGTDDGAGKFAAGEVRVWDAETGRTSSSMKVGGTRVYAVAFSPDGGQVASAWEDKTVRVWDAANGRELFALAGHGDEVRNVAWSPDGKHLISAGADQTVRVWEVETRKETRRHRGFNAAALRADGKSPWPRAAAKGFASGTRPQASRSGPSKVESATRAWRQSDDKHRHRRRASSIRSRVVDGGNKMVVPPTRRRVGASQPEGLRVLSPGLLLPPPRGGKTASWTDRLRWLRVNSIRHQKLFSVPPTDRPASESRRP